MDHLTPEQIARWNSRSMAAQELLAVSDHVARCEQCTNRLRGARTLEQAAAALQRELSEARSDVHLRGDQLVALVDGSASTELQASAAAHVETCSTCRDELDDLRRFAAERRSERAPRWRIAAAVAAMAIGAAIWFAGARRIDSTPAQSPSVAALVTLRDGSGEIALLATGTVQGVPEQFAADVARLLRAPAALAVPEGVLALAREMERPRSVATEPGEVAVVAPVSTVELEDHPVFRWSGPAGVAYSVSVFDSQFNRVASSGAVPDDHWRADLPLPRSELLTWRIETTIRGRTRVYPTPPRPPAVFRIASIEQVTRVDAARQTGSHLLLGLALWDAGGVEQAAAEFSRVREANPDSAVAVELAQHSEQAVAALHRYEADR